MPETAIVILSSDADKRFIEEAKKIDARAHVVKEKATLFHSGQLSSVNERRIVLHKDMGAYSELNGIQFYDLHANRVAAGK